MSMASRRSQQSPTRLGGPGVEVNSVEMAETEDFEEIEVAEIEVPVQVVQGGHNTQPPIQDTKGLARLTSLPSRPARSTGTGASPLTTVWSRPHVRGSHSSLQDSQELEIINEVSTS